MIEFKPYPIYINYSNPQDEERLENEFRRNADRHMVDWFQNTGRRLLETRQGAVTREAVAYEQSVAMQLEIISQTRIGKLLFGSLKSDPKIWIVPFHSDEQEICGCAAGTLGTFNRKQGGGIRLFYVPSDFGPGNQAYTPDDVLFHEMVHAYRIGRVGASGQKRTPMREYVTAEEFLAIHMQNVYIDCRGKTRYYRSHTDPILRTKAHIYEEFGEDGEVMQALDYFVNYEPFARAVAQWPYPYPNFNPWRDHPQLLRIYEDKTGSHGKFLPL